ncbi:MAG TPA: AsmA family protein, partial [Methylophilaceae bacterium]|nr:AsmA family protein [Methylophilaceae bacterium]
PLNVSGTLDHPVVLPSNAALAGAAVGTAVLGPGVGTSLGIKASKGLDKLKGLFGGD